MLRKILAVMALVAVMGTLLGVILPVAAQSGPSATRSFSSTSVAAGAEVTVTIAFANTGALGGRVTETLPAGFTYKSSSLGDENVTVNGQEVRFSLFGVTSPFTYTVTASSTAGAHTFSGELRDSDRNNHDVGGPSRVTVQAPPAGASPSATRSFSSTSVAAGADVTVTITFANTGTLGGRVTETLPAGFTYKSSSLGDENVTVNGQEVRFSLFGVTSPFTYTVTASSTAGAHTFSGELRDSDRNNHPVDGPSRVTVQAPPAGASPSATRSFSSTSVAAGAEVTVTIRVANYGEFGRVTETLPGGFTYKSSSLDASQVDASGQEVQFTLQGESSFTYVVTASSMAGAHAFSGMLRDSDRNNHTVGGASSVKVTVPPGPASRSLPTRVSPGNNFTVRITASDYGEFGRVTETLPGGFTYTFL